MSPRPVADHLAVVHVAVTMTLPLSSITVIRAGVHAGIGVCWRCDAAVAILLAEPDVVLVAKGNIIPSGKATPFSGNCASSR